MFFPDCEHLASEEPDLRERIRLIDAKLSGFAASSTIQPRLLAAGADVEDNITDMILSRLAHGGLLEAGSVIRCPRCGTLVSEDSYSQALDNGESLECTGCFREIVEPEGNRTTVYHFSTKGKEYLGSRPPARSSSRENRITGSNEDRLELVLLVHGIRTAATWQGMVKQALQRESRTVVCPLKYGYFDSLSFWCPLFTRKRPIDELLYKIEDAIAGSPNAELVIVAHSFGTYAITKILRQKPGIRPSRMILCGSIVPRRFRWDLLPNRPKVINDCGSRDIWPILAQSTTWGYGATGVLGFGFPNVKDRFHDMSHSDYFDEAFVERFWRPWVQDEQYVESEYECRQPPVPLWRLMLSIFPLKYVPFVLAVIAAYCVWLRF